MMRDGATATKSQAEAINSTDRSVAVIAGAGSGKTRVLIERCLKMLEERDDALDHFLAITFTEKAAAELRTRLRPHLTRHQVMKLQNAWIGTFHALCVRILRAHAPLANLSPSFRILDENESKLLTHAAIEEGFFRLLEEREPHVERLLELFKFRHTLELLDELMDFRWHARELFLDDPSPEMEERERTAHAALKIIFTVAVEMLKYRFDREEAIDFQELEIRTIELLSTHRDVLGSYQKRFRHLLVDEYQDTNDIQTELVRLLHHPEKNHLFIVGDPRQSIYRFRGANVGCFLQMLKTLENEGGKIITLSENFRSQPEILNAVNRVASPLEEELFHAKVGLIPTRPQEGASLTILSLESAGNAEERREGEACALAEHILQLTQEEEITFGNIAFLFQALTAAAPYEDALKRHGIPYRFYGGHRFLERQEVRDLTAALEYAADPKNDTALIALLRSPLIGLSDNECVLLAGPEGHDLKKNLHRHPKTKLLEELKHRARVLLPSELITFVLEETGYELLCAELDPSGGKRANIGRLISICRHLERRLSLSLSELVAYLRDLEQRNARLGDAPATSDNADVVRCMTVHAAKGLEFPVVILPDLNRISRNRTEPWIFVRGKGLGLKFRHDRFPFAPLEPSKTYESLLKEEKQEDELERRRLLYVAMTRAKDRLVLPMHLNTKSKGNWCQWLEILCCQENT